MQNCLGLGCLKIRLRCEWTGKVTCKNEVWKQKKIAKKKTKVYRFLFREAPEQFKVFKENTTGIIKKKTLFKID